MVNNRSGPRGRSRLRSRSRSKSQSRFSSQSRSRTSSRRDRRSKRRRPRGQSRHSSRSWQGRLPFGPVPAEGDIHLRGHARSPVDVNVWMQYRRVPWTLAWTTIPLQRPAVGHAEGYLVRMLRVLDGTESGAHGDGPAPLRVQVGPHEDAEMESINLECAVIVHSGTPGLTADVSRREEGPVDGLG